MKIFLIGYYGFHNAGDQICLDNAILLLKTKFPSSSFKILHIKEESGRYQYINRWSIKSLYKTIRNSDLIIFGGGGIFQDSTSIKSFLYYWSLLLFSVITRKDVYILGQGIGPIKSKILSFLFQSIINKVKKISVRDQSSYNWLLKRYYPAERLILSSDLAFYNAKFLAKEYPEKTVIAVSLRVLEQPINKNVFANLLSNRGKKIEFYDFQPPLDQEYFKSFFSQPVEIKSAFEYLQGKKISKIPQAFLAMRYHSAVLATIWGVPFFALVYDPKIKHLAQDLGQPYLDLSKSFNFQVMMDTWEDFLNHLNHYKELLINKRSQLQKRALLNLGIFYESK